MGIKERGQNMNDGVISIRESDGSIVKLEPYTILPSTLELAREYAKKGYPDRYAVFAERQIKTKTTGWKDNETEYENGVFLSLILRPSIFPSQASLMGAMSAVALVTALEEHTPKHLGIGWVSDLYCEGVKVGGVTVEGKLDSFTAYEYIIVNFAVKTSDETFPPRLTDMIKKVFESDNTSLSMIMAKDILAKFFKFYSNMKNSSKFMSVYKDKFLFRGKRIKYDDGIKKQKCRVLGIDLKTGALIAEMRGGVMKHVTTPMYISAPKRVRINKKR